MPSFDQRRPSPTLLLGLALSLALHGLVLFLPTRESSAPAPPARRLTATLAPRPAPPIALAPPSTPAPQAQPAPAKPVQVKPTPAKPPPRKEVLATIKPKGHPTAPPPPPSPPRWSPAERQEMDRFLGELEQHARGEPDPAAGRGRPRPGPEEGSEILERLPNSPPVDRFSLEMYLDALVRKLNRAAAFVSNDPRGRGLGTGRVRIRLNPDGSLRSFEVVDAADQQEQIAFVKSVVERAVPFSPFPADILRSARSLAMMICIQPREGGDGIGFSRIPAGQGC